MLHGMSKQEKQWLDALLSSESSESEQTKLLAKIGDYMEESYILNLPLSKPLQNGLGAYAGNARNTPANKHKAKRLLKAYKTF